MLVARDDSLYGPFESGLAKINSFLVCYRPLALKGKGAHKAVLREIDNESLASILEQSCKEQSLQQ